MVVKPLSAHILQHCSYLSKSFKEFVEKECSAAKRAVDALEALHYPGKRFVRQLDKVTSALAHGSGVRVARTYRADQYNRYVTDRDFTDSWSLSNLAASLDCVNLKSLLHLLATKGSFLIPVSTTNKQMHKDLISHVSVMVLLNNGSEIKIMFFNPSGKKCSSKFIGRAFIEAILDESKPYPELYNFFHQQWPEIPKDFQHLLPDSVQHGATLFSEACTHLSRYFINTTLEKVVSGQDIQFAMRDTAVEIQLFGWQMIYSRHTTLEKSNALRSKIQKRIGCHYILNLATDVSSEPSTLNQVDTNYIAAMDHDLMDNDNDFDDYGYNFDEFFNPYSPPGSPFNWSQVYTPPQSPATQSDETQEPMEVTVENVLDVEENVQAGGAEPMDVDVQDNDDDVGEAIVANHVPSQESLSQPVHDVNVPESGQSIPSESDWSKAFTLQKISHNHNKKFNHHQYFYSLKIKSLPQEFDTVTSLEALPEVFKAVWKACSKDFQPHDAVCITLFTRTMENPMHLRMQFFSNFNPRDLTEMVMKINSGGLFCIDDSLRLVIQRTVIPAGGARVRKHIHSTHDRKRFARSIVQVDVGYNLCLPACLVLGRFYHDPAKNIRNWKQLTDKREKKLQELAAKLVEEAGLTVGTKFSLNDIERFQTTALKEFQIKVVGAEQGNIIIARCPERQGKLETIYLLYENGHFDLITSPSGFHRRGYYCELCDKAYVQKEKHRCQGKCTKCYRPREVCVEPEETSRILCTDCNREFNNNKCYDLHKKARKNGRPYCTELFICPNCGVFVSLLNRKFKKHECGEMFCHPCQEWVDQATHKCYLKPLEPRVHGSSSNYIFFDYETYLDAEGIHRPCYVVAQYTSGEEFRFPPDNVPMGGYDVQKEFGQWVYSEQHRGYTLIAHNFRGYDGHFLLSYLLENNLKGVEVIRRGSQLLDLRYPALEIKARDTLNFVMTKLSNFPKAVGLTECESKGDFPHRFNKPENWDKVLPFPDVDEYMVDGLKRADRRKFEQWHAEEKQKKGVFNFRAEMSDYCSRDVTILRKCALQFRENFINMTNVDPFQNVTIASACQTYYKTKLLKAKEIAVISANGYQPNRKTSAEATQWLEWISMSHPNIEHGRNGKERKINRYFVDGFDPDTKTVYEYNGCVHHGHPECTNEDDRAPFSLKKMSEVYEQWIRKKLFLEGMGYNVEEKWSCEWLRERKDPDIQQFLLNQNLRDPLQPRDAFKGGRTNASCLFREVQEDEQILHYDIVSLYPFVNKKAEYPIGHPKIIVTNFKPVTEYFGLVKCKVLPPARIRYPVLPATFNGKLVFTLCRTCAENGINDYCSHSDEERSFEGVFCTPELHMALRQGYQVQEIYEVWHWNEKRAGLFQEYVDKFLKEKLEKLPCAMEFS
ncbi:uncharacterized protein LOC129599526 [Paramacrobiotus metropolitanus]|uniref:uncharacterized protein LOC129599526 n=1 Tax=Paramacrobiotus metropolitanus TaxID=2943436 RepID=UPI00244570D4|nr:uncharacterized protein LOC129599526 [Paramacrobiotus metropolitanus]